MKSYLTLKGSLTGKKFYCNVLTGNDGYNFSINSDMSVSCTCADYDGSGRIGNLREQTLNEVLSGPKAVFFRKSLAYGKIPILPCTTCSGLCSISAKKAEQFRHEYTIPTNGIMVENTVNCNLRCISCPRHLITKTHSRRSMSLDDIRIVSKMIRDNGIKVVSYFKLGEPFFSPYIYDELSIIRNDNPDLFIRIETNGMLLDTDRKRDAALLANSIRFAIDGVDQQSITRYRKNDNFARVYDNFKKLIEYRNGKGLKVPVIDWKYIVFNWNDKEETLLKATELAKSAGSDGIWFWPTISPFWSVSLRYKYKKYSDALLKYKQDDSFYVKVN